MSNVHIHGRFSYNFHTTKTVPRINIEHNKTCIIPPLAFIGVGPLPKLSNKIKYIIINYPEKFPEYYKFPHTTKSIYLYSFFSYDVPMYNLKSWNSWFYITHSKLQRIIKINTRNKTMKSRGLFDL